MKIFFSIIIPHRNVPKLLQKCLDSIPVRDDVQVIVVDDNSSSDAVDFDNFPKWEGRNFECYFTKKGKGAGYARNVGLTHAIGEWLLFGDSDDVFEPDFGKILDLLKEDKQSDLVNFDVTARNIEDDSPNDEIEKTGYHCSKPEYIEHPETFKYIVLTPWGKAIRRSLIEMHNIRFEEVKYGNDILFSTLCDFYCTHRHIIPLIGYCYMYRKNSLWRQESLEWAIVRYGVLMNAGCIMRRLGDESIANRYLNGAYYFVEIIKKYSSWQYIKHIVHYAINRPNLKLLYYLSKETIRRWINKLSF